MKHLPTRVHRASQATGLFDRVVSILEEARGRVVRSVNTHTVTAYWMIGREIVEALQRGAERAEYGTGLIEELSRRLTKRYGRGFSAPNLKNFRQFYLAFPTRVPGIGYPAGSQLALPVKGRPLRDGPDPAAFHAALSWSHYRALMRVEKPEARDFYEQEAVACNWSKTQLERQIETLFYERLLASRDKRGMLQEARRSKRARDTLAPIDVLKDPYILEFLDLPDTPRLHESDLESAIIGKLQHFLLEMRHPPVIEPEENG